MNFLVIAALVALVPVGAAVFLLYRTLSVQRNLDDTSADGFLLAPEKYRPMARLLHAADFRFLSSQAGYNAQLGSRFRAERRKIFRAYLANLKSDFKRVSLTFQTLIVHSAEDRGDLAAALVRQRMVFAFAILAIEGRLLLHSLGVNSVTVEVSGLVDSLEAMQAQMSLLLAPQVAAVGA